MSKRYHVYGVGAALVDTEIQVTDADLAAMSVEKGVMTLVDEARQAQLLQHLTGHLVHSKRASGGSAANTIIAVAQFGGSTFYSCKVANDDHGHFYLHDLKAAGVDCHIDKERDHGVTGKCLVMITPDAERTMNTYLGISETLSVSDLSHDAIAASEYVYLEGYLVTSPSGRAAAIRAREIAEQRGVKTALSFSDPGIVAHFRDGLKDMIGNKIDLLFCNHHEALSWSQTDNLEAAIVEIKKIANQFAITLGAEGALVFDGTTQHHIAPHKVTAVDTNGAGDMFAGAFLYGVTQGKSFADAGRLASVAAATVVSDYGPRLSAAQQRQIIDDLKFH
ncbi:MAG TPA: adenosine kinase, partial [Spongiibacteraceae bacterium]|nr:adenosine kinase [Spongiibacteraceae bacterium]